MFAGVKGVLKKGGEAVSSTAQAVTGVGRAGNVSDGFDADNLIKNAKARYDLDLKCTPSKDALTCSKLSCRNGFLVKKNEQGNWQRRFVCLVPHTFLYYFDSETSQDPRGVIDMELFSNLSVEGADCNIMKMSTLDENERSPLKSYFFQFDDPNMMSEWMTAVIRDKFSVMKEERDQYLSLQENVASMINSSKKATESTAMEKDKMQQDIIRASQTNDENMTQMRRILVRFGISENDMKKLDTGVKICENILVQIDKMRDSSERAIKESRVRELEEKKLLEQRIAQLETTMTQESQDRAQETLQRKQMEQRHSEQLLELQSKLEEAMGEIERAGLNTQMAVAAKSAAETKSSTLSEQKKILVKEVKQLRTKADEDKDAITTLQSTNEKLTSQLASLQERFIQLTTITNTNAKERIASSHSLSSKDDDNGSNSDSGSSHGNSRQESTEASSLDDKKSSITSLFASSLFKSSDNSNKASSSSSASEDIINGGDDADAGFSIDNSGDGLGVNSSNSSNNSNSEDSTSMFGFSMGGNSNRQQQYQHSRPISTNESRMTQLLSTSQDSKPNRRSSLDMLSSIFQFDKSNASPVLVDDTAPSGGATRDSNKEANLLNMYEIYNKNATANSDLVEPHNSMYTSPIATKSDSSSSPSTNTSEGVFKIHCLRCNGTVEGPQYSTCKCTTPALSQDDLKEKSTFSVFGNILNF